MDGASINAKIYAGRAKVALRLGLDCNVFRPLSAAAPLGNQVATTKAAFNNGDNNYRNPNLPGDSIWFADLDGRITQPGDYLVRGSDGCLFYIADQQYLLPIIAIKCNRTVVASRQQPVASVGAVGYGGNLPTQEIAVLGAPGAGWPASILLMGGNQPSEGFGAGVKEARWRVMLPFSVPVLLKSGDIITDDLGKRYVAEGLEKTDFGWRIDAHEVHS